MIDHVNTTKTSHFHQQPRPARRLKKIFCPRHKVQDEHELAISPPIIDSVYSPLASPTNLKNHGPSPYQQQHHQPFVLNSVPPRVSSMPKRTSTMPTPSKTTSTSLHSSLPRPPRKSMSRPRPAPSQQDRRHSFHLPPTNVSATSVRTAPPATTFTTPSSSRLADLGNKTKRQSRAAASVAVSGAPVPIKSRSTPMRVKTYNVNYNPQAEMERVRKQKELEELIAGGRRGSTLKLSLTPRGL